MRTFGAGVLVVTLVFGIQARAAPGGGSADLSILNVGADGKLTLLGKVPTAADAHTAAFDPATRRIFVGAPEHGAVIIVRDPFPAK